ncbi:MAG: MATE family efflux transporter [Planctomycetota bacterium]|jgi:putative MATE family efflux protein
MAEDPEHPPEGEAAPAPPQPRSVIIREVFRLAWPAMMQAFMGTVVFFFDRLMLGRHDKNEIASLIAAGTILWSLTSIFGVWTVGTLAVIARDKGAGRAETIRFHVTTSIGLSLVIGAFIAVTGALLAGPLVGFFDTEPAVARAAEEYLRILCLVMPVTFVGLTLMAAFTGAGDTFTPMVASGVSNVLNIVGNYLLIFGHFGFPELGIRGAAISSAAAFGVFTLLLFLLLFRKRSVIPIGLGDFTRFSRDSLRRILRVSFPAAAERLIFHAGFVGYARIVTGLGTLAMAAQEALIAIQSIVFLPGEGFGIAAGSIMGRHLGAGRPEDALRGAKVATWMAVVPLVTAGLVFLFIPDRLIGLFTDNWVIVAIGVPALIIGAFEGLFLGAFQVLSGGMRGAGDTRTPMVVTTTGIWLVRLPLCAFFGPPPEMTWGLGLGLGLKGVWMGTLTDWVVRAVLITLAFKRGRWRKTKV